MNREEAKTLQSIINAYAKGYTIQQKIDDEWIDLTDPYFDADVNEYRVKPESKYRPFKNFEECWNEMHKHQPFGWVKSKVSTCYSLLTAVCCLYVREGTHRRYFSFSESFKTKDDDVSPIEILFESYTFADGTPFGTKED